MRNWSPLGGKDQAWKSSKLDYASGSAKELITLSVESGVLPLALCFEESKQDPPTICRVDDNFFDGFAMFAHESKIRERRHNVSWLVVTS